MPDWNQVLDELSALDTASLNKFDTLRRRYLKHLHKLTDRNVIAYYSGWLQKPELDSKSNSAFLCQIGRLLSFYFLWGKSLSISRY